MKRVTWFALSWLVLLTTAHATSFDCARALTKVERLICADSELSKLDERLDAAYKIALQDQKQADTLRQAQKQWMKARNGCADAACVKLSYETRLNALSNTGEISVTLEALVSSSNTYVQTASAEDELLGDWSGNDHASESIYGAMRIGKKQILWGGSNPYNPECHTTYTLVTKYTDTTYPGNTFPLIKGRTFTIYKLKLDLQDCTRRLGYFQFALPSDIKEYAEVVTYDRDDEESGWHNFSKIDDQPETNHK